MKRKDKVKKSGVRGKGEPTEVLARLSTPRPSTLILTEQTGNVDENKQQGQKVEESGVSPGKSEARPTPEG